MGFTLAVERSSPPGSWALFRGRNRVAGGSFVSAPGRAPAWAAALRAGLADLGVAPAGLDRLVVGMGPGSFSGIRAALALAQGLALPRDRPVFGLSSAAALARRAALQENQPVVAVVGDARRGRLWCAVYRCLPDGRLVLAASGRTPEHGGGDFTLATWDTLSATIPEEARVVSPEWERLAGGFAARRFGLASPTASAAPTADDLGALFLADEAAAHRDPSPVYLHPAVA